MLTMIMLLYANTNIIVLPLWGFIAKFNKHFKLYHKADTLSIVFFKKISFFSSFCRKLR